MSRSSRRRGKARAAQTPKSPSADHNLATDQFPGLNREFYRADPTDYIQRRLRALVISVAESPAIDGALKQGVHYRSITVRREGGHEEDREAAEAYLSMESTNLLHHGAESMLRLYFAHADHPPCPWLEISRRDKPGEFKDRVDQLRGALQQQETIDSLRTIFFGNTTPDALGWSFTADEWQRKTDGLLMLVDYLCTTVLNEAPMYNATKHGLAVVGGNSGLKISAPDDELTISTDGPGLTYLGTTPASATDRRRWTKTLTFVRSEANLGMIEIVALYIRSMWTIARFRYLHTQDEPPMIMMIEPDKLREIIETGLEGPFGFAGMTQTLGYYADDARPVVSHPTRSVTGSTAGDTPAGASTDVHADAPSAEPA